MKLVPFTLKKFEKRLSDLIENQFKIQGILCNPTNIIQDYDFLLEKFGPGQQLISEIYKIDQKIGLRYDLTMPLIN